MTTFGWRIDAIMPASCRTQLALLIRLASSMCMYDIAKQNMLLKLEYSSRLDTTEITCITAVPSNSIALPSDVGDEQRPAASREDE